MTTKKTAAKKTTAKKTTAKKTTAKKAVAKSRPPKYSEITEDQWIETYRPIINKFDPDGSWGGTLFETFGEEMEFIAEQDPRKIWTWLVDGDSSSVQSGFHYINRMGYFICEVPLAKPKGTIGILVD